MSGDHPSYNIIENRQNTEKSPGDLRRLAVAQTPDRPPVDADVKNSQGVNNDNNNNTNKRYMHNAAPVLENDSHKLLWDFNIQMDQLIPARRPDLIIINNKKENLQNCRLCYPGGSQNKSEGKWKEG